jgi:ribosomal protein S18 acetylase RimI-like enzyme
MLPSDFFHRNVVLSFLNKSDRYSPCAAPRRSHPNSPWLLLSTLGLLQYHQFAMGEHGWDRSYLIPNSVFVPRAVELAEPASGSKVLPHHRELQSRRCRPAGRYGTVDQRYGAGLCCRPGGTLDVSRSAAIPRLLRRFIRAFAGKAFSTGTAWRIDGNLGGALWLPPGVKPDEDAIVAILEESVPPDVKADANAMFGEMAGDHPRDPHWYLPTIGIEPDLHRKGPGSALLTEGLSRCDQEHMPAYLDSSNSANAALYQRLGFKALGVIRAGGSPPMVLMLRDAR